MSGAGMSADGLAILLQKFPVLKRKFAGWVQMAAAGKRLPERVTLKEAGYGLQMELEKFLGVRFRRSGNGTIAGEMPEGLREPEVWRDVAELLGVEWRERRDGGSKEFLLKMRWMYPEAAGALDELEGQGEVIRFLEDGENMAVWGKLFKAMVLRVGKVFSGQRPTAGSQCSEATMPTTLSQLGADVLNDSKALRSGRLRGQLGMMLAALTGMGDAEERDVFAAADIAENPYTSAVTLYLPVRLKMKSGETLDFPLTMFGMGLAVQLPLETVEATDGVEWAGDGEKLIWTSENAAPFMRMVREGRRCVYTEGYPNGAVQKFLAMLGAAGAKAVHEGDADLDGFRIAEVVGRCIPVERTVAEDVATDPADVQGIPLTNRQRARWAKHLESNPGWRYAEAVKKLLERGQWHEQERMA